MSKQRRQKRKGEVADELLTSLVQRFIKFKNQHFVEENGVLIFDTEVTDLKNELKREWISFCNLHKSDRDLNYNPKALHNMIEDHIDKHRKLSYVNQVMRLMKVNYQTGTEEYDQILVAYENGTSCEDAAHDFATAVFEEDLAIA